MRVFRVRMALWEGLHTAAHRGSSRCVDDRVTRGVTAGVTGVVTDSVTEGVTGVVTRSVTPRLVFRGRAVNDTGGRHAPIDTAIFTTMSVYER